MPTAAQHITMWFSKAKPQDDSPMLKPITSRTNLLNMVNTLYLTAGHKHNNGSV